MGDGAAAAGPAPPGLVPHGAGAAGTGPAAAAETPALRSAQRKLFWRVTLLLGLVVVFNFLDKGNLAFASLQMTQQLGFSPAVYGLGAGVLFAGYAAFMVPANMLLPLVGGPRWLAALCVAWGVTATAGAAVRDEASFLALRALLGVTEAGVVPAILFYLTNFYSQSRLTVPYTVVVLGQTVAQVVGAPLAAAILRLDGAAGLPGWRWLFLLEGVPSVVMALPMWHLPTSIDEVRYLTAEEKAAVAASLAAPEAEAALPGGGVAPAAANGGGQAARPAKSAPSGPGRESDVATAGWADAADAAASSPEPPLKASAPNGGDLPAGAEPDSGGGGGGDGSRGSGSCGGGSGGVQGCWAGAGRALVELGRVLRLPVVVCGSAWSVLLGMTTQAFNYFTPLIVASLLDAGLTDPSSRGAAAAAGAAKPAAPAAPAGGAAGTTAVALSAAPFAAAALLQAAAGWSSQKTGERRWHTAAAFSLSGVAMLLLPLAMARGAPGASFGLLIVATAAAFAGTAPNLSWKNAMLPPWARLTGMPVMIAVTSVGGFIGPFAMGSLRTSSGNFYSSFWLLGSCILAAAAMVAAFPSEWAAPGSEERARAAARRERRRLKGRGPRQLQVAAAEGAGRGDDALV